ncbi:MAG: hypothetical protein ACRYHA_17475 [Janthinobacterium lividum]
MMTFDSSITRISAVDPLGATSAASAAGSIARPDAASAAPGAANGAAGATNGVAAPASAEQVDKFKTMLDQATSNVQSQSPSHVATGPSAIADVVDSQDAAFNQLGSEMEAFQANATTMDPRAFSAQMVRMQFQVADAMAKIELGVGFAQGGKSAVQNLMKNQ